MNNVTNQAYFYIYEVCINSIRELPFYNSYHLLPVFLLYLMTFHFLISVIFFSYDYFFFF
jgi:hypothetical protein